MATAIAPSVQGIKQVAWLDCPGGGQVSVDGTTAYIAHMKAPHGTSIVDVSDPARPRTLATVEVPPQTHSHKVRVANGLMLVNREAQPAHQPPAGVGGGLVIYDVSDPGRPREITFWKCGGAGVHRFTFDGRYAYISPEMDGYVGNIVMILDLYDPATPKEVGRWWMPGQWTGGGETPTWAGRHHRCHHPIRSGDRLYVSYWHGGFVILDIDDMSKPKMLSHVDWSPPFPWPTHTCLRIPFKIDNRDFMVVTDEDVVRLEGCPPYPASFMWLVDITDERHPFPVSSYQIEGIGPEQQPYMTGCHQPCEIVMGTEIPVAWFAHGLRIIDISRPHALKEVAFYMPDVPPGSERVQSNDVTVDDRGLIYLLDRVRGLHILERIG
jgi:hypothetical protein